MNISFTKCGYMLCVINLDLIFIYPKKIEQIAPVMGDILKHDNVFKKKLNWTKLNHNRP